MHQTNLSLKSELVSSERWTSKSFSKTTVKIKVLNLKDSLFSLSLKKNKLVRGYTLTSQDAFLHF